VPIRDSLGALPPDPRDFGGMALVSEGRESPEAWSFRGLPVAIGAPSTRLSLVGLRPRRARLRFTWPADGNDFTTELQEQDHGSGTVTDDSLTCECLNR
jgi:hypothetical protein